METSCPFPSSILVQVAPACPEGLPILLTFEMTCKNNFSYVLFMQSDRETELNASELLRSFDEDRNMFVMDYGDPRICFNGRIQADVLNSSAVSGAINAFDSFSNHYVYPRDFRINLVRAQQLLQDEDPRKYSITVEARYREERQL